MRRRRGIALRRRLVAGSVLLGATSAAACTAPSRPGPSGSTPDAVAVRGVRVTPQSVQLAAIGERRRLTAAVVPADATDRRVVWESTDSTVAAVDTAGVVTAKAVGFGILVTAYTHDGHFQASVAVSVDP